MIIYIIKRVFWFIPTLFTVTLIGFFLLKNAPGDPVSLLVNSSITNSNSKSPQNKEEQKKKLIKQLGLDLPTFYFSIQQLSEPDTLYKLYDSEKLKTYKALLDKTGNASAITRYFNAINQMHQYIHSEFQSKNYRTQIIVNPKIDQHLQSMLLSTQALEINESLNVQEYHLKQLQCHLSYLLVNYKSKIFTHNILKAYFNLCLAHYNVRYNTSVYKNYIPKFTWFGVNNQYQQWLFGGQNSKGIIRGDFGISYVKNQPVIDIIKDKIIWSLFFSITSILIAYGISIPIGIKMAEKPTHRFTKLSQILLFMLYSLPPFFVGVLLLMLFANPDVLSIFPPSGVKPIGGYSDDATFFNKLSDSLPYMILPLICYTYSSLAFISKLTTTTINEQLTHDYIRTAKAKGLTEKKLIWKHAFKNSLLPLITVFTSIFPTIIGGSVIIESVFTIPGMGLETVKAITTQDYPIVIAIITISTLLTMISYLLSDILYALADPRIRK